jgi:hypothetical protein
VSPRNFRFQVSGVGGQRAEDREQRTEDRKQKSEVGIPIFKPIKPIEIIKSIKLTVFSFLHLVP